MKSSVPAPVIVVAILVVIALVGIFAMRTFGSQSAASTDLGAKTDLGKLKNMSPQDIQQMKTEMDRARNGRGSITK